MITIKVVYVVRKHILEPGTGEEIRHEDYPQEFDSHENARSFMRQKQQKYVTSLEDALDDGAHPDSLEGRRFEIVSK